MKDDVINCLSHALRVNAISFVEQRFATAKELDDKVSVLPKLQEIAANHDREIRFVGNQLEEAESSLQNGEWLICLFGFWETEVIFFGFSNKMVDYHFVRRERKDFWTQLSYDTQIVERADIREMLNCCELEGVPRHEFYAIKCV